jgi:bacterioferritin
MKDAVIAELLQHAADELRHAEMLTLRILQLGGTPVISPKAWYEWTNCGYDEPADPYVGTLLEQNVKGERCAIGVYSKMIEITKQNDPITADLALKILEDEVEHEEDLQALQEDLELMLPRAK